MDAKSYLRNCLEKKINRMWYQHGHSLLSDVLLPIAMIFKYLASVRRFIYKRSASPITTPIIVVGNLTVGGVGKTPFVIALAKALQAEGVRVGIVSRGYGARVKHFPHHVQLTDSASCVGDEPLLIAQHTACPVVIAPKRTEAVHFLLKNHQPQVILSDDGLQHYAMKRTLEIVLIDGVRQLGNQRCLPSGPLREPVKRLQEVDFIVMNGHQQMQDCDQPIYHMQLQASEPRQLGTNKVVAWQDLAQPITAIAGIGHPERFFSTLQTLNIPHQAYAFPDHHAFSAQDFAKFDKTVLMTEKDAVKCAPFGTKNMYYLPIEAVWSQAFWRAFWEKLQNLMIP